MDDFPVFFFSSNIFCCILVLVLSNSALITATVDGLGKIELVHFFNWFPRVSVVDGVGVMGMQWVESFCWGLGYRECIICEGDATFLRGDVPCSLFLGSNRVECRI